MDLEQYQEAQTQFEKILLTEPNNDKVLHNIGIFC